MASHLRILSTRALFQSCNNLRCNSASSSLFPKNGLIPRRTPPTPRRLSPLTLTQRNTMATDAAAAAAPKKVEWLVVIPDFPGAQEKRLEVRSYVQLTTLLLGYNIRVP